MIDQLLLAVGHVVLDPGHPRKPLDRGDQFDDRGFQLGAGLAGQPHLDVATGGAGATFDDRERLHPGGDAHALAPDADQLAVAYLAVVRFGQFHAHRRQVIAELALSRALAVDAAEPGDRDAHQRFPELLLGGGERRFDLVHERGDPRARGAGDEADVGMQHATLGRGEEIELQAAAGKQPQRQHQHRQRHADGDPGAPHAGFGKGSKAALAKTLEAAFERPAQAPDRGVVNRHEGMAQVPGKDQKTLHQRGGDDTHHHQRNIEQDLADDSADQHQWHERGDGGQRRRDDRRQHAPRAALGGL